MDPQYLNLLILCLLLVAPRALQRARIPGPLTCLLIGLAFVHVLPGRDAGLAKFPAMLGITTIFLFAGMEVDFVQLRKRARSLAGYAGLRIAAIAAISLLAMQVLGVVWQAAVLLALALLTSSTGFILDSLDRFSMEAEERETISNEAITGELLALAILFAVLQSTETLRLVQAVSVLVALLVVIPLVYLGLQRWVLPHAPGSEFSLLITVAVVAAFVTEKLGVEYLLGAFIAGVTAAQMAAHGWLPRSPSTMQAVKLFSTFFMPFYFFYNGAHVPAEALTLQAAGVGLLLCLLIPLRFGAAWLRRKLSRDSPRSANRVAISLLPTLIFTLVLTQILRREFGVADSVIGGLLLYAFVNTLLPSLLLRVGLEEG